MQQREDHKRWMLQFVNLYELTQWIERTPPTWKSAFSRYRGSPGWSLGHSYEDCLRMAATGWEDGVKQLYALSAVVPNATRTTLSYNVAGDFPDVPRAVAGDPFNMVRRGKERVPKPTLTIAVNIRASSAVGDQEMANFGAAVVALVDRLESQGVRVELIGLYGDSGRKRYCISWHIKRAEDHLDLAAAAFSLAHPGMFRRLGFACVERSGRHNETPGYGHGGRISRDDFIDLPEGALLINGVDDSPGSCRTMENALKFAKDRINEAAVKQGGEPITELEEL